MRDSQTIENENGGRPNAHANRASGTRLRSEAHGNARDDTTTKSAVLPACLFNTGEAQHQKHAMPTKNECCAPGCLFDPGEARHLGHADPEGSHVVHLAHKVAVNPHCPETNELPR